MSNVQADSAYQETFRILSVVIPCFNEKANVLPVYEAVRKHTSELAGTVEIILIDDGSTDETWQEIERLSDQQAGVTGLKLSRNFGKEAAIAAGLSRSAGDIVVLMDADLQHPPALIPKMVHRWQQGGVEIVEAVKKSRGEESGWKKVSARVFYAVFGKLAELDITDACDFKLLSRKALDAWKALPERNLFFRGMSVWIGYPRAGIEFSVPGRVSGQSGWRLMKLGRLAISALTSYSSAPLRVVGLTGLLFGLFAIVLSVQTLGNYFSGRAVSGFTTVIILLLMVGAAILFGLAIIGEYIARIYDEIKARPRYLIEQISGEARPAQGEKIVAPK